MMDTVNKINCASNAALDLPRMDHNEMQKQGNVLIVGLGVTGLSCARFLVQQGWQVSITDTQLQPPGLAQLRAEALPVKTQLGALACADLAQIDMVIVSPGVSLQTPLLAQALALGKPVFGDVELFVRFAQQPIIAITGSNGKSTVTCLIGEMVKKTGQLPAVGANLGEPALDLLALPDVDVYVLELSSFQLETVTSLRAKAAVVLNVSPDHMDRYADVDAYSHAKQRIYQGAEHKIVNADDARVMGMLSADDQAIQFSLGAPASDGFGIIEHAGEAYFCHGPQRLMPVAQARLLGTHNWANILAAFALGHAYGLPMLAMIEAVKTFKGLAHRMEWVAEHRGVVWINDSKGTNVGATLAAIQGLDKPVILIAGGRGKQADFSPLREVVARGAVRELILLGEDAQVIAQAVAPKVCHFAASMQQAVAMAGACAAAGEVVLMSPACASFDMFAGFAQRGEIFKQAVQQWIDQCPA